MKLSLAIVPASALLFYLSISAAPQAVFKSTTYDCGSIIEGKTDVLHAEFVITNTGDEDLKITNVRPGCGCTNIKFDSTVAPGATMILKSDVNIKGYRSGPVSKSITFTSNSEKNPTEKLVIQAQIVAPVSASERYISLKASFKDKPYVLDILSMKKELKVTDVSFKVTQSSDKGSWQSDLPIEIKYTLAPKDTVRTDGISVFTLGMFAPAVKGVQHGDFIIKTDNPDTKEVVVQGILGYN